MADRAPMRRTRVRVMKANGIGRDDVIDDVEISIDGDGMTFDGERTIDQWSDLYEKQALLLVRALRSSLPGGTLDRMIAILLMQKASHFRVTWDRRESERSPTVEAHDDWGLILDGLRELSGGPRLPAVRISELEVVVGSGHVRPWREHAILVLAAISRSRARDDAAGAAGEVKQR